ncbi:SIMPL domain-containing protein (plasmid) [Deinococcus sp. KNUC1210]|uniref:SIMPL domain-containing protein n=1 Tax=Deinococcus sp. KNUC1210 TaxID=2917691 RepID=UPI001EF02DBA|nr:SIMPL domain-containing protein [Deinococcus sp. KNUC1210]ULH18143.1 SIMPL domain-containing protein [Deinococcus sp. KNUC1210]
MNATKSRAGQLSTDMLGTCRRKRHLDVFQMPLTLFLTARGSRCRQTQRHIADGSEPLPESRFPERDSLERDVSAVLSGYRTDMGVLRIQQKDHLDVTAVSANLHLEIAGETLVMGNAAMERIKEVRDLTQQLQAAGLPATQIQVRGVDISNRTGLLTKHQKARFFMVVGMDTSLLPQVLGLLADQKHVNLQRLEWIFDEFEASLMLGPQAMRKARRRADVIAEAAGHRVVGVLNASDTWEMPVSSINLQTDWTSQDVQRAPRARAGSLDAGVEYSSTRVVTVQLTVDFQLE